MEADHEFTIRLSQNSYIVKLFEGIELEERDGAVACARAVRGQRP
jgi:hypothetical protein